MEMAEGMEHQSVPPIDRGNILLRVITCNGGSNSVPKNFDDLLGFPAGNSNPFDLYAVGFQGTKNGHTTKRNWLLDFESGLAGEFIRIASKKSTGMLLSIYVRQKWATKIRILETGSIPPQYALLIPKDALWISMKFCDRNFCFVSCHLPSDESKDLKVIEGISRSIAGSRIKRSLEEFDFSFFFGALGLGVDKRVDEGRAKFILSSMDSIHLTPFDELSNLLASRTLIGLEDFIELQPTFQPACVERKGRVIPWPDRILWRAKDWSSVQPSSYQLHEGHIEGIQMPVSCNFITRVSQPGRPEDVYFFDQIDRDAAGNFSIQFAAHRSFEISTSDRVCLFLRTFRSVHDFLDSQPVHCHPPPTEMPGGFKEIPHDYVAYSRQVRLPSACEMHSFLLAYVRGMDILALDAFERPFNIFPHDKP